MQGTFETQSTPNPKSFPQGPVVQLREMSHFFSCKVTKKGGPTPFVPRPVEMEGTEEMLQIVGACIPASVDLKNGSRVSINIKTPDMEEPVAIATMVVGQLDSVSLGLLLDGYAEFSIDGPAKAEVHLTGFYNPNHSAGGDGEEDEEEAAADMIRKVLPSAWAGISCLVLQLCAVCVRLMLLHNLCQVTSLVVCGRSI